jgi:hypothetical protein
MRLRNVLIPIAVVVASGAFVPTAQASSGHQSLRAVRHATARFRTLSVAEGAGYGRLVDAAGVACIDMPGMGAMGVHYVNGDFVGDAVLDPLKPEALVYETDEDARQNLVAVEYITFQSAWDAGHADAPTLFGRAFDVTPAPNRFGLPAFYSLHAWVWRRNPAGTFAMFNPRVTCSPGDDDDGRQDGDAHSGHGEG